MALRSLGAVTLLAGCSQREQKPWRQLSFGDIQIEETTHGAIVTLELEKVDRPPEKLATFHDVVVHGYDQHLTEICPKELGTITETYPGGNGLPIEMDCSAVPTMLTYSAVESPCDAEIVTEIKIAVYDEDRGWLHDYHDRECDEGPSISRREIRR